MAEVDAECGDVGLEWGPNTTVNDAIPGWQRNGWDDLSPSTITRYRSIWNAHIRDTIGQRRIRSLGPYEVERFLRGLKSKGLSEASVRQVRAVAHRACRLARKWSGNRLPNPVSGTELPEWRYGEQRDAVRVPNVDEVRALLDAAARYDRRIGVFIRLVAATGARRGEACAIRWSDLDLVQGSVTIDEGIVMKSGASVVKAPKNRTSVRHVALDAATLHELQELRTEREAIALACGMPLADTASSSRPIRGGRRLRTPTP